MSFFILIFLVISRLVLCHVSTKHSHDDSNHVQNVILHDIGTAATITEIDLSDSVPVFASLSAGQTVQFRFAKETESTSYAGETIYVYGSVCTQPQIFESVTTENYLGLFDDYTSDLSLSLITMESSTVAELNTTNYDSYSELEFGLMNYTNPALGEDLHIAMAAPTYNVSKYSGNWTISMLATTNKNISLFTAEDGLYALDTAQTEALLLTTDSTAIESDTDRIYNLYIYPDFDLSVETIYRSYCAITNGHFVATDAQADISITQKLWGNNSRELFYVKGLNSSYQYKAYVTKPNTTNGDLAEAYPSAYFATKRTSSCTIIYDLDFCSEVAYAVPTSNSISQDALRDWFDQNAQSLYDGFNKTMQLMTCDLAEDIRYTVMRTCADCDLSYKRWLCATTIPRCTDSSIGGSNTSTIYRDTGSSRNDIMNTELNPLPYYELLPCASVCHKVMQDCPSDLQFTCPYEGKGLNLSYANVGYTSNFGTQGLGCNFLGPATQYSVSSKKQVTSRQILYAVFGTILLNVSICNLM
ncbi:stretch-activated Ca2+-permeable channel component-domain-containing protein [Dipodascopsis uninucleata]